MQREEIQNLVNKYLNDTATAAELEQLSAWYRSASEENLEWFADVKDEERLLKAAMYSRIEQELGIEQKKTKKLWPRYAGIAAAVIGIAIGTYFYSSHQPDTTRHPELVSGSQDIAPGKNTAVLTVNGKQTQLSDAKAGIIVTNDIKYNDGTTLSSSALGMTEGESRSLEVITPKGGTYSIILQDGTKVWLNADSKLEFLSNYKNKLQRIVKLTGEAYFEVAKILSPTGRDGRRPERVPFLVESNGQRVEVLGTHFNISAYKGETIKTTLLEGSVIVSSLRGGTTKQPPLDIAASRNAPRNDGKGVILKPNQQSTVHLSPPGRDGEAREGNITVKQVDATEAITWKNGKFSFEREEMLSIMRKVARWYNVDVVFQEPLQQVKLTGSISRFENVSKLLDMLENTKEVHFKIEGRTVYVTK